MANFEKAIKTLEFDRVLEQLAAAAQTDGAKEKAMRVMPQTSLVRIRKLQMQCLGRASVGAEPGEFYRFLHQMIFLRLIVVW